MCIGNRHAIWPTIALAHAVKLTSNVMPFFSALFLVIPITLLLLVVIIAIVRRGWPVAVFALIVAAAWWWIAAPHEEYLGRFEANGTQIALYHEPWDEGFLFARVSGRSSNSFEYDIVIGQGVDGSEVIRGFYASHSDAIWIFVHGPSNITEQPVVLCLDTGNIISGPKAGALPSDAAGLTLKR